ncbi:MAG: hypothetical protein AAF108_04630 [Planctomycetota bacterium]
MLGKLFESRNKRLARLEREAVDAWHASGRDGPAPALLVRTLLFELAARHDASTAVITSVRDEGSIHGLPDRFARVVMCNAPDAALDRIGRGTLSLPHVEHRVGDAREIVSQTLFAADRPVVVVASAPRELAVGVVAEALRDPSARHSVIVDHARLFVAHLGEPDLTEIEELARPAGFEFTERNGLLAVTPRIRS